MRCNTHASAKCQRENGFIGPIYRARRWDAGHLAGENAREAAGRSTVPSSAAEDFRKYQFKLISANLLLE